MSICPSRSHISSWALTSHVTSGPPVTLKCPSSSNQHFLLPSASRAGYSCSAISRPPVNPRFDPVTRCILKCLLGGVSRTGPFLPALPAGTVFPSERAAAGSLRWLSGRGGVGKGIRTPRGARCSWVLFTHHRMGFS